LKEELSEINLMGNYFISKVFFRNQT